MHILKKKYLLLCSLFMLSALLGTSLAAQEFTITNHGETENRSHWVCDYTRGAYDTLFLRCDNLVGLLYDHMLLMDGPESKTTKYIPIWRRADRDKDAINLVKTVLCKEETDCEVEMGHSWAANFN